MTDWYDRKIVGSALLLLTIIAVALLLWSFVFSPALEVTKKEPITPTVTYTYMQGLTVRFRIMDQTTTTMVDDLAGCTATFYRTTADPFALLSMDQPVALAAFDDTAGVNAWIAVLNAGSYKVLIADGAAIYPVIYTVNVPGTNDTLMQVNLNPYMLTVVERATPTIDVLINEYDPVTGLYDSPVADITDPGVAARWQVTYTTSSAGLFMQIAPGRIYLTTYPGLSLMSATVNNVPVVVKLDADGTDDGLTGPYIEFPVMTGGTVTTVNVVLARTALLTTGTYYMTLYEAYEVHNPIPRWWTDETADFDVIAL